MKTQSQHTGKHNASASHPLDATSERNKRKYTHRKSLVGQNEKTIFENNKPKTKQKSKNNKKRIIDK